MQFTTNPASGVIYQGEGCGSNGAIGTNSDGSGQLMVCQGGVWGPEAPPPTSQLVYDNTLYDSYGAWFWQGITWANICVIAAQDGGPQGGYHLIQPFAGPNAQGQYYWEFNGHDDNGYSASNHILCWNIT